MLTASILCACRPTACDDKEVVSERKSISIKNLTIKRHNTQRFYVHFNFYCATCNADAV